MPALFDRARLLWRASDDAATAVQTPDRTQILQPILDSLPFGLGMFDEAQRLVNCNALFLSLLGVPAQALLQGLDFPTLVDMTRRGADEGRGLLLLDGRPQREPRRFERVMPDGTPVEVHVAALPQGGQSMTLLPAAAQRQAATDLRRSQAVMDLLGRHCATQVVYWDGAQVCRQANAAFLQAIGKREQEVVGRPLHEVFSGDVRMERRERVAAALGGEAQQLEESARDAQGNARSWRLHFIPDIEQQRVVGCLMLALDLSELRQAQAEGSQAVEARNQFVANMGHELRTPMNAIMGMLQLVENSGLTTRQKDHVAKAQAAARSLVAVMSDIMDFASVEAGNVTLNAHSFDVEELLRDLSAVYAHAIGEKPLDFVFDISPQLPPRLVADDQRLRQLLINLGSNAIKFTERGHVVLSMQVAARSMSSITLDVVVSDTGIGIEPAKLRQLMQDFGQAEGAASRRFGGSGLGLAICRKLLRLMGSELRAQSEPGRGSRFGFRIELPVSTDPATPHPAPVEGVRMLVADSRPVTRQAHARLARSLGWQAVEVQSLQEALDTLRHSGFLNLVLADSRLDGSADFSAALQLTQTLAGRSVPVIVTGGEHGRDQLTSLPEAKRQQLSGYLCDPATAQMLAEAVAEAHSAWAPPAAAVNPKKPLAGLNILVAEDNENNQIVTRELLQEQGAKVEIAIDGLDALTRLVAGGQYDAILMDWQMPNMDGLEASREIRQIVGYQDVPIIGLTANATAADRAACLEAGMNAHLGKPVELSELVSTVLRYTRPGQG